MHPTLLLFTLFIAIAFIVAAVMLFVRDLVFGGRAVVDQRIGEGGREPTLQRLRLVGDEVPATSFTGKIDQSFGRLIAETGNDMAPEAGFLLCIFVGLLIGGALYLWQNDELIAVGGILAGIVITMIVFFWQRSRRHAAIRDQLPDVMDVLARAVRAGESLDQAIALVGDTSPDPLGTEFRRCAKQLDMGLSMDAAMRSLTRRAPITEMRILAATFMVQRYTGGNLPVTLERLAGVVRDRLSYRRHFRATTASGRIGTILIALAGPFIVTYMLIFQPEYIRSFSTMPGGWTLLAISIALQLVGLIWIYNLLRTDY